MIRFALPLIALAVAACQPAARPGTPPAAPGVECNANGLGHLIGKQPTESLIAEAKRLSGANAVRVIRPDMMVTMEFRADRLNLHLSTEGKVASARCG